jgi:Lipase (class 3)
MLAELDAVGDKPPMALDDVPFFRSFNRLDFVFVGCCANALIQNNPSLAKVCCGAFAPGEFTFFPGNGLFPDSFVYVTSDYCIVDTQGTSNYFQYIAEFLGSVQGANPPYPGLTVQFFADSANYVRRAIDSIVTPLLGSRRMVFLGHSLGGVVAHILVSYYGPLATRGASCLTLAAPRGGNPAWAIVADPFVQRVQNIGDLVPALPPTLWAAAGSNYPIPGMGAVTTNVAPGTVKTLQSNGAWVDGESLLETPFIVQNLAAGNLAIHWSQTYVAWLEAGSGLGDLAPGAQGYVNPPQLFGAYLQMSGILPPIPAALILEDGPMQLVQGLIYFRDSGVSEGFSEAIYQVSTISAMNAYLQSILGLRAAFLGTDLEMHAIRASNVGGNKLSSVIKFASPTQGTGSDQSNEVPDAVLYNMKTAVNSHRQMTFRGVPDGWIQGGKLTAVGRGGLANIDAYMNNLLANGVGLKIPDASQLKIPLVSLANSVAGGPLLGTTALAHNLVSGDVVNIQGIRNYPYLLGRWVVSVPSATTFFLIGSARYQANLAGVGTVQNLEFVLQTATAFGFNMVATRATGRPFGQPRGRRSAKVLHH